MKKILALLDVNNSVRYKECDTLEEAKRVTEEWLLDAKRAFPHGHFVPKYYFSDDSLV